MVVNGGFRRMMVVHSRKRGVQKQVEYSCGQERNGCLLLPVVHFSVGYFRGLVARYVTEEYFRVTVARYVTEASYAFGHPYFHCLQPVTNLLFDFSELFADWLPDEFCLRLFVYQYCYRPAADCIAFPAYVHTACYSIYVAAPALYFVPVLTHHSVKMKVVVPVRDED